MIRKSINRVKGIVLKALKQGTTPHTLAITCAFGVVLSVFPVYGVTTLLCFLVAIPFRLNVVVIQTVNYLLTPLQLLLMIPIWQSGIFVFNLKTIPLDYERIVVRSQDDFGTLMSELGSVVAGGIMVWTFLAIPVFFILFIIFKILFSSTRKIGSHNSAT